MQVAVYPGAASAPDKHSAGRDVAAKLVESLSVSSLHIVQQQQLAVHEVKVISPAGLMALDYVASSQKLSQEEKRTLIRLIAIVDEFAGGDPKLMRDIVGIAKIMEMDGVEKFSTMSMQEALREYFEERERLNPSDSVIISAETEILAVQVQYSAVAQIAPQEAAIKSPA